MTAREEISQLRKELAEYGRAYHELDAPLVEDYEYDELLRRLRELEREYPEFASPDSPTEKVGGRPSGAFAPVTHTVAMQSLNDVFSFDEVVAFVEKTAESAAHGYCVEPKIDGLSVSLEYRNGVFFRGATRGDGVTGEDVTANLRTIKNVPQTLENAPEMLLVRAEVFMPRSVFNELNSEMQSSGKQPFANPRNAAAGSLRQIDPEVCRARRLDIYTFNIQQIAGKSFETHAETLEYLEQLGFKAVRRKVCADSAEVLAEIGQIDALRESFEYDIDGAVVKMNGIAARGEIGGTARAPRWAVAYKYPPEERETTLLDITIQVGRTGVLTPKAAVAPVRLSGTTVSSATLHNADFIAERDIRIGDTVVIRKAGEIIPEVMSVVLTKRPAGTAPYVFPNECPDCGSGVTRDEGGAHIRCRNVECPAQLLRNIVHFCSRRAMDIEGCGETVVKQLLDTGVITSAADLFELDASVLEQLKRFGKKSAENLVAAAERSKERGLAALLFALGIPQIGESAAKLLAARFGSMDRLMRATEGELTAIEDIGGVTARFLIDWFTRPQSQKLIERLRESGVVMTAEVTTPATGAFSGQTVVLTGALTRFTRDAAAAEIEKRGGAVKNTVTKKTTLVVAGEDAGSKLAKARELGIAVVDEQEFINMLG